MRLVGASCLLVVALALPDRAWAQDTEVEGFFVASVGFTDNVDNRSSTPDEALPPGAPPEPGPQADGFTALSPSVALIHTRPRWVFRSSYTFNTSIYFTNPEANTVGNAVGLASRFETSETTSLLLSLGAEQGQLNQVVVGQTASQANTQFIDPGDNVYLRFTAGEGFEIQASENVSILQTLDASLYVPLDGQRVQTYGGTLGVTRTFNYDSLGVTAGVAYTSFEAFENETVQGPVVTPTTQQLLTRLTGTWIHNYSDYLSHQLDAGMVMVMRANDGGGRLVQPVGRAALRYLRPEANASIEYAHDAGPDPFLGTNILTDSVTVRLLVPITRTELAVEGSGSFSQARTIDREGTIHEPANLWAGDVALLWAPAGVRGNLQMALRYQVINQGRPADEIDPSVGYIPQRDFTRNTVLLSVTAAYPDVERAMAPAGSAPPFRPNPASSGSGRILEEADPSAPEGPTTPSGPRAPAPPPGAPGDDD